MPYKAYATVDGELVIAAGSDGLFRKLAAVVGHPEWAGDERFADNPSRVRHQAELYRMLDEIIAGHCENWRLERLAAIDRAILRLALHELRGGETPGKVVMNEAIELAKKFSSLESSGFVNGILDSAYKSLQAK